MNVRIVPRGAPKRTDLYSVPRTVRSDGETLILITAGGVIQRLPLKSVAEILLDDDPGGGF